MTESRDCKVYMLTLPFDPVTLNGPGSVSMVMQAPIRITRIIVHSQDARSKWDWLFLFLRLYFGWILIPWLYYSYDLERRVIVLRSAFRLLYSHVSAVAQRKALASTYVDSIRIDDVEMVIGPIPAGVFSHLSMGTQLEFPTAPKGSTLSVRLTGKGGPITVAFSGITIRN